MHCSWDLDFSVSLPASAISLRCFPEPQIGSPQTFIIISAGPTLFPSYSCNGVSWIPYGKQYQLSLFSCVKDFTTQRRWDTYLAAFSCLGVNVIDLYQVLCHRDPFLGLSPIIFVSCLEKKPSSGCEFALHLQFLRLQYSLTRQDLVFTISLIEVAELSLLASGGICFLRMNPHMSLQCLWKTNVMMKLLVNEGNNKHTSAKCFPNCLIWAFVVSTYLLA